MSYIKEKLRQAALEIGFCQVGFAPLNDLPHANFFRRWLEQGMAGKMGYLCRQSELRHSPRALLSGGHTAMVVVASYAGPPAEDDLPENHGLIARFARGLDYHLVLRRRLDLLAAQIHQLTGEQATYRIAVDSSPLLERELAMAAGVGFIAKNTCLITPGVGSFTVLGVLLMELPLPPDAPAPARCGQCTLCLEACPTGALVKPYTLDSRRCISCLTIEHRGYIAPELRKHISPWIFGCDICQEVCPHNAKAGVRGKIDQDLAPAVPLRSLDLVETLMLRSGAYRRLVKGRSLRRVSRNTLIRNAAVAAGGLSLLNPELENALEQVRASPVAEIAEAASWALDRSG